MQQQKYPDVRGDSLISVLYDRHASTIFTYLRQHAPSREDAEDMLLEVFLAALERSVLSGLAEEEQLAWLRRVAHNKLIDSYRRAIYRQSVTLEQVAETMYDAEELAPEQLALRNEEFTQLRATLKHLPVIQQEILHLRFANGLRCAEIATMVGKTEGAVRMLLSRSLNALRTLYREQKEER
jgi:RNA polymerase sigma factor (sigma-70 family)